MTKKNEQLYYRLPMNPTTSTIRTPGLLPMAKVMTLSGMAIAGLIALIFGLDLILAIPFGRQNVIMDLGMVICAGILGYLSWNAYREV